MEISGSRVIITGGASGIGLEIVKQLITNGAKKIAFLDFDKNRGEETVKALNIEYGVDKVVFIHCDVSKKEDYEEGFQKAIDQIGGLDLLINNAGILDENRWELTIQINMTAVTRGTMLALEAMGKHKGGKGGTIVNIASIAAFIAYNSSPVYSATKAAVIAIVRGFGHEVNFNRYGVRVMAMCPGVTETSLMRRKLADRGIDYKKISYQPSSFVAENMITLLKTGSTGEIFVCELSQPIYKINMPDYQDLKI